MTWPVPASGSFEDPERSSSGRAAIPLIQPTWAASPSASSVKLVREMHLFERPEKLGAGECVTPGFRAMSRYALAVRLDQILDRREYSIFHPTCVPEQSERAGRAQDPMDLGENRVAVEPVECLAHGYDVGRPVRKPNRLGRPFDCLHAGTDRAPHRLHRFNGDYPRARGGESTGLSFPVPAASVDDGRARPQFQPAGRASEWQSLWIFRAAALIGVR